MANTTVIFDNATLSDAVNKAARIAPTKGAAFDKTAGIHFTVNPAQKSVVVRATDLEVSYEQIIPILEGKGDPTTWRIPSQLLQGLVSTLPMGDGNHVEFIDRGDPSAIRLKSGRTIAKINMYADEMNLAIFDWKPLTEFVPAPDLISRIEQVSWATDPKSNVLSGVHIDGEDLLATNSYVLASVPAKIPVQTPMTVPLSTLTALVKGASDCRIAPGDKRCFLALDAETKATTGLLEGKYPNVKSVMRTDFIGTFKAHRQQMTDLLDRLMVLARTDKLPTLRLEVNGTGFVKMATFDLEVPDQGRMQDSMDVTSEYEDVWEINFIPRMVADALSHAKSDFVELDFGHPDPAKTSITPVRLRDDQGYQCYIMPKRISK